MSAPRHPGSDLTGPSGGRVPEDTRMKSKRIQALVLATALVAGYTGAAAFSAWGLPAVPVATGFGPDDGLTRFVLTASSGTASDDLLAALEATAGVVDAQRLRDGRALVATEGLGPHHLEVVPGVADADFSTTVPVLGAVTDPYFPNYGCNLDNTGGNAYGQYADRERRRRRPRGLGRRHRRGAIVAVVDTGYDSDHPELAGALWTNPSLRLRRRRRRHRRRLPRLELHDQQRGRRQRQLRHARRERLRRRRRRGRQRHGHRRRRAGRHDMPLVIGSGSSVDMNLGIEAIYYAVDHGADVINASWGGGATSSALANLRAAIRYAGDHGVLVVAAAGNDAANRDFSLMYPASLDEPALVTVGNSNAADRDQRQLRLRRRLGGSLRPGRARLHHVERRRLPPRLRHLDRVPAGRGRVRDVPRRVARGDDRRAAPGAA